MQNTLETKPMKGGSSKPSSVSQLKKELKEKDKAIIEVQSTAEQEIKEVKKELRKEVKEKEQEIDKEKARNDELKELFIAFVEKQNKIKWYEKPCDENSSQCDELDKQCLCDEISKGNSLT